MRFPGLALAAAALLGTAGCMNSRVTDEESVKYGKLVHAAQVFAVQGNYAETRVYCSNAMGPTRFMRCRDAAGNLFTRMEERDPAHVRVRSFEKEYDFYPLTRVAIRRPGPLYPVNPEIPDLSEFSLYTAVEGKCGDIPCLFITETGNRSRECFEALLRVYRQREKAQKLPHVSDGELWKKFSKPPEEYIVYGIGKEDGFMHSRIVYGLDGKMKYGYRSVDVELNPELPGELFELPPGYRVREPATENEYWEMNRDAGKAERAATAKRGK